MKKLYLLASSMLLAATSFAAQGDPYWYISGAFNNYNPDYNDKWALMDDDEGKEEFYTGVFTVDEGMFSFNLVNPEGQIFVPMDEDMDLTPMVVTFVNNTFNGTASLAWDDDEESYYWTDPTWPGGQITVNLYPNGNNPSIIIYANPKAVGESDLYVIEGPTDGIITITWEDYMVWPAGSGAYLQPVNGEKINLYRKGQALDYQIYLNEDEDEIPGVITVDLNSLDLADGVYTLVIPEGYVDVISEDYEYWESNPEISKTFQIGEAEEPVVGYWYIRGAFNNYNPDGLDKWALMDDDQGEDGVYTGTFEVAAGAFSFNLMNSADQIFVPMDEDMDLTPMEVTFVNNTFIGTASLAWDDDEEAYYWTYPSWEGGQITVSVNTNGNNPTIEIYAFPKQEVGDTDLYVIAGPEDGVITITWEDYMVWPAGSGAYLQPVDGEKIELARKGQAVDYQISLNEDEDEIPGVITVDLNSLDLADGVYTLVIPEGYVDVISEDYEYWESNPEIAYTFQVGEAEEPVVGYWYIRGAFNNYNPEGDDEWALMEDDEGEAGVYTGTFEVAAGAFSFNLMNSADQIFVPMDEDMDLTPMVVTFVNNTFTGTASLAWDDDEESYYWTDPTWAGGQITVSVNANGNNPTIEIYAFPEMNEFNEDYTLTPLNEDGIITIYWDEVDDVWYEKGDAYIENAEGNKIDLAKNISGQAGQVTLCDEDPYGLIIDITSLDLEAGEYTLVIPAKYIQVVSGDYEDFLYNPEIIYTFKVTTVGVKSLAVDGELNVYTIQGVKVNAADLNNLSNGVYIINGKKVMIRK